MISGVPGGCHDRAMTTSPSVLPSDELTPLIAHGGEFCVAGMTLIDNLRSEDGTGLTLPEATVVRLHFVAASTLQSGLLCLWMPETSLASYGLIRGLLEVWAHLTFISDDSQGGDARCRALRYERGALRAWSNSVLSAPGYVDTAAWRRLHDERARDVEETWTACGCVGPHRTRKHVEATLRVLATQPHMEWVPAVWSASSASTHGYGVDFLLQSQGGETRLGWALASQRATWFSFLVAAYAYLTETGAGILSKGDPTIDAFHTAGEVVLKNDVLAGIIRGEFDK